MRGPKKIGKMNFTSNASAVGKGRTEGAPTRENGEGIVGGNIERVRGNQMGEEFQISIQFFGTLLLVSKGREREMKTVRRAYSIHTKALQ
jgi:hypothetical protein